MAGRLAGIIEGGFHGQEVTLYSSTDLNEYTQVTFAPLEYISSNTEYGIYNWYRIATANNFAITGRINESFFGDYYNRIHINPLSIELGNLTTAQVQPVEIWNAYTTQQTLSSIDESGIDGITLTQPDSLPSVYNPLQEKTYYVNIDSNGASTIDAIYTFNFTSDVLKLAITGSRVVVFPFKPLQVFSEDLEWATDVIQTFSKEQRLSLRKAPRQKFSYEYFLDQEKFSRAKLIGKGWSYRNYGVPVWSERTYIGNVAAGTTSISFDTSNADYRENDVALLWSSDTDFLTVQTTTISPTGINLKLPTEVSISNAYVMPLRFGLALGGISFSRYNHTHTSVATTFTCTESVDLGDASEYPIYNGYPVYNKLITLQESVSEKLLRSVTEFDNGSGAIEVEINNSWVNNQRTVNIRAETKAEIWNLRKFLHYLRGKRAAFYLPTWNPDLTATENIAASSGFIKVKNIGYGLYVSKSDIMIRKKDNSKIYATITSSAIDVNGDEILYLSNPIGQEILLSDIMYICFMDLVRLDSDNVTIAHDEVEAVSVSVPVLEVPQ